MECLSDEMQAFVPDDLAQGSVHFFLGQCAQQMNFYAEAKEQFDLCVETHYTDNNHHSFLVHFARAKVLQCLGDHTEALEKFNYCLTLDPKSAHCLFRRAWSQKVSLLFLLRQLINKLIWLLVGTGKLRCCRGGL